MRETTHNRSTNEKGKENREEVALTQMPTSQGQEQMKSNATSETCPCNRDCVCSLFVSLARPPLARGRRRFECAVPGPWARKNHSFRRLLKNRWSIACSTRGCFARRPIGKLICDTSNVHCGDVWLVNPSARSRANSRASRPRPGERDGLRHNTMVSMVTESPLIKSLVRSFVQLLFQARSATKADKDSHTCWPDSSPMVWPRI